eukprot:15392568-Alexandrium_andersonii.AAC.1
MAIALAVAVALARVPALAACSPIPEVSPRLFLPKVQDNQVRSDRIRGFLQSSLCCRPWLNIVMNGAIMGDFDLAG